MILKIGILAIQGGFSEHIVAFQKCSIEYSNKDIQIELFELRSSQDLSENLDGIILPGGESTAMGRILCQNSFGEKLKEFIKDKTKNRYVWGTCSGLIILANNLENQKDGGQYHIGGIDITVSRNYFGRQLNSFEAPVKLADSNISGNMFHGVFIRAPAILSCDSSEAKILGTIANKKEPEKEDVIVAVTQKNLLATAFHPELTENLLWHKYFIDLIVANKS